MSVARLVTVVVLAGCAPTQVSAPPPLPVPMPPPGTTVAARFPVRVWVEEVERTANSATVVVHVERLNALELPLTVRVDVPSSAVNLKGTGAVQLPPGDGPDHWRHTLTVSFAELPREDLVVHVDGETSGMGFHGTATYRFGRPPPPQPAVDRSGPSPFTRGASPPGGSIPVP